MRHFIHIEIIKKYGIWNEGDSVWRRGPELRSRHTVPVLNRKEGKVLNREMGVIERLLVAHLDNWLLWSSELSSNASG